MHCQQYSDIVEKRAYLLGYNLPVHFGDNRYQDYTQHKDSKRKENYISRHAKNEDWSKSNIASAGFMSRHILWEKDTINKSIQNLNSKYKDVKFKYKNIQFLKKVFKQ